MGRASAIANLFYALFPFAIGLAVAVLVGLDRFNWLTIALSLATLSLVALLAVKIPALRRGHLVNFGPKQAGESKRWLWWLSVGLLLFSVLITAIAVRVL